MLEACQALSRGHAGGGRFQHAATHHPQRLSRHHLGCEGLSLLPNASVVLPLLFLLLLSWLLIPASGL